MSFASFARRSDPASENKTLSKGATAGLRVGEVNSGPECDADRMADEVILNPPPRIRWSLANIGISQGRQHNSDMVGGGVPPIVAEVLNSSGTPLDTATRNFFEPRFSCDFRAVRIHADARSSESARAIRASAYAFGNHLAFADGRYAPETPSGRELIAHELAHAAQVSTVSASMKYKWRISRENDPAEHKAAEMARESLAGRPVGTTAASPLQIYRNGDANPPAAPSTPPPVPRRVHLDTTVFDQINRGNVDAANKLKQLKEQGVEICVSVPVEVEATLRGKDARIRANNKLIIEEFGMRRVPAGKLAERVSTYEKYATTKVSVQAKDISILEAAASDGAELWTTEGNLPTQSKAIMKHLGLKIAEESTNVRSVSGSYDYARARKLLGLDPVTIEADGTVIRPSRGGGGAAGGGAGGTESPVGGAGAAGEGEPQHGPRAPGAQSAEEGTETPSRAIGGAGEHAEPGFKSAVGSQLLGLGAGLASGFLQQEFHDKVLTDLGNLPKPRIDRRGAGEFLHDPATTTSLQLLDVFDKDLKPFISGLEPEHQRIMTGAEFNVLAVALLAGKTSSDIEKKFARLDAVAQELADYDQELSIVQANLEAVLSLEPQAMDTKNKTDQLIALLPDLFEMQAVAAETVGIGQIPDIDDYTKMDSGLRYVSASIRIAFADAHDAKMLVDRLIDEESKVRQELQKIWWNEFAAQVNKLAKEHPDQALALPPAKVPATGLAPSPAPPASIPSPLSGVMNSDQRGILAMLETRVEELLFQIRQTEADLESKISTQNLDVLFNKRQSLFEQYREAAKQLEDFKKKFGLSPNE
jgi:hypothetical protein